MTFTNKATDEMKSRILSALTAISQMEKEEDIVKTEFAKDLLEGNPSWDFTQLVEKAKSALGQILHDYSQFSIMTIDKFFNRIVKSFLFELKLQNTSKVSMDTQQALDESIAEMLSEYNQDMNDVLSRWLKDIAAQNLNEGKNWQPENIIKRISGELLKERSTQWNLNYPIEKVEKLYQQFVEIENSFDSAIKDYAKDIIAAVRKSGLEEGYFSRNSFPNQTKRFLDDPSKEHYTE
ncbi:MAG TPA: UvrD-helicase domain-containing protein, partial [Chitinophagales bacterium]|nr:UvrD-helicase domain-containing protein [Chitinophagales bacterium]